MCKTQILTGIKLTLKPLIMKTTTYNNELETIKKMVYNKGHNLTIDDRINIKRYIDKIIKTMI